MKLATGSPRIILWLGREEVFLLLQEASYKSPRQGLWLVWLESQSNLWTNHCGQGPWGSTTEQFLQPEGQNWEENGGFHLEQLTRARRGGVYQIEWVAVSRRKERWEADNQLLFTCSLLAFWCIPSFSFVSKCRKIGKFQCIYSCWMHPDIQNKACLESTFLCEKGTCHAISGVNR